MCTVFVIEGPTSVTLVYLLDRLDPGTSDFGVVIGPLVDFNAAEFL